MLENLIPIHVNEPSDLRGCTVNNIGGEYGWIQLVDFMGDDRRIADAARLSYGATAEEYSNDQVRTLNRFMMRHDHTSPFEQCEVVFRVQCPMDVWRQWIRHRTANVNEYSTRYTDAIDHMALAREWRTQSTDSKQGSAGVVEDPGVVDMLSAMEKGLHDQARTVYRVRLENGVAREQARKDLPLSTYTRAYWKIDLHNLFHFLSKRLPTDAQSEIREFGWAMASFLQPLFPMAWEAFLDYKLLAVTFSRMELKALYAAIKYGSLPEPGWEGMSKRECREFEKKINGILSPNSI